MQLNYTATMPFEVHNYHEYHNHGPVVVIPYTLFDRYQYFRVTSCLHLQMYMEVAGLVIYQNAQCQITQVYSFSRNTDLTAWCMGLR